MVDLYKSWKLLEAIQTQGLPLQPKIQLPDGTRVMVYDGSYLRNNIEVDFIGGGHHYEYDFVPEDEIWLENLSSEEQRFILIHEVSERLIMKYRKWGYEESHNTANFLESMFRHNHNMMEVFPWFIESYIMNAAPEYTPELGAQIMQAIMSYK